MKIRLDQYLVQHGLTQSRERAKALIMSGIVFVNEQKADKAGEMIKEDAKVEVRGHDIGYVSRGGLKLEKAMKCFPLTPNGKVCMDIGASTGGFTDCMLQHGAAKVYAIDVGTRTAGAVPAGGSPRGKLGGNRRSQHCTGTAETAGGFLLGGRVFHLAAPCTALRAAAAADRGTGRGAHQAPV